MLKKQRPSVNETRILWIDEECAVRTVSLLDRQHTPGPSRRSKHESDAGTVSIDMPVEETPVNKNP